MCYIKLKGNQTTLDSASAWEPEERQKTFRKKNVRRAAQAREGNELRRKTEKNS